MEAKAYPVGGQVPQQAQAVNPDPRLGGVQPGGAYVNESYCGVISIVIGVFLLPCICCCPVDKREVYLEPGTGRRIVLA